MLGNTIWKAILKFMPMGTTHSVIVIVIFKYFTVSDKFFQMTNLCSEHVVSDIEMHSEKEHHNKVVVTLFNGNTTLSKYTHLYVFI